MRSTPRRRSLVVALATALVLPLVAAPSAMAVVKDGARPVSFERSVVAQVNAARAKDGLPSLLELPALRTDARGWSSYLAKRSTTVAKGKRLKHQSLATMKKDARDAGCTGRYAEIVLWATPAPSAAKIVSSYLASSGHRDKVLATRFTHVGSGTVVRNGITFNTIRFASGCARTSSKVAGWATKRSQTVGRTQKDAIVVSAVAPRKVKLQKRSGGSWKTVKTYTTSRTGRVTVTLPRSSKVGSASFRVYAPQTTTHKAVASKVTTVTYRR
ncbi:CAP domain-containing protein [Sanguibacter sp. HDW7]|uniref:CAP domain-containing protein n=1 Tax=Sanguibacter sp. HDW7 TaxID=2714931 RepID=UPI001409CDC2|nr:CAP domain-containing protein [Sanguibacter sp. HDW7]QIK82663.1 CAP domain-containing protein [Sanguibacter sp. HDW7]